MVEAAHVLYIHCYILLHYYPRTGGHCNPKLYIHTVVSFGTEEISVEVEGISSIYNVTRPSRKCRSLD